MAERNGLLNRRTLTRVPRVRIPVSPQESVRDGRCIEVLKIKRWRADTPASPSFNMSTGHLHSVRGVA